MDTADTILIGGAFVAWMALVVAGLLIQRQHRRRSGRP